MDARFLAGLHSGMGIGAKGLVAAVLLLAVVGFFLGNYFSVESGSLNQSTPPIPESGLLPNLNWIFTALGFSEPRGTELEGFLILAILVGIGGLVGLEVDGFDFLGDLDAHFTRWPLEDRYKEAHVAKVMDCNWKVAQEAFMEAFHVVATHPQAAAFMANAQMAVTIERLAAPSPLSLVEIRG